MRGFLAATAVVLVACGTSLGGVYDYGDFYGQDVDFIGVSESSETDSQALFGTPSVSSNSLVFMPASNDSTASNGGTDETIGVLSMTVNAKGDQEIRGVQILELGSVAISGQTTNATYASYANDLEVIVSGTSYTDSVADTFYTSVPMWDGSTYVDLYGMGIRGVTSVSLSFTSALATESESGTTSHIEASLLEKEIMVGVIIPEPATLALLGIGGLAVLIRRR
ncbi:MAG: PEP-CTERM sorting domain-containing protein [Phycisphaerae bacterium]